MKKIEQEGEQKKTTREKEKVVRYRRPRETALGHSQKMKKMRHKTGRKQTAQVACGDGR